MVFSGEKTFIVESLSYGRMIRSIATYAFKVPTRLANDFIEYG